VPIPGTTKLHRLEANIGVANVELTSADLREVDHAASKVNYDQVRRGFRYPLV
jgi:aryl-alcohol dehydrogenase-like predicted oxidoreductase